MTLESPERLSDWLSPTRNSTLTALHAHSTDHIASVSHLSSKITTHMSCVYDFRRLQPAFQLPIDLHLFITIAWRRCSCYCRSCAAMSSFSKIRKLLPGSLDDKSVHGLCCSNSAEDCIVQNRADTGDEYSLHIQCRSLRPQGCRPVLNESLAV